MGPLPIYILLNLMPRTLPDSALIKCWGAYIPRGSGHSTGEETPLHGTRGRIAAHALPPFPLWCGIDNTACGIEDDPHQFLTDVDKYQRAAGISDTDMCVVWGRMMGSDGRGKEGGRHKHDSGDTPRWWNSLGEPDSLAQCKEWFVAQYVGTANLVADATHRFHDLQRGSMSMHALGTYLVKWGRLPKLDDGVQIHRFMSLLTPQENVTLFTQFPVQQRQQAGNLDMAFLLQTVSKIMQLERTSAAGSRRSSGARIASSHPTPTRGVLQVPLEEDGASDAESTLGDLPKSILAITKTTDRWAPPPSKIGAASTSSSVGPSGTAAPSSLGPSASRIGAADDLLFKRMEDFMDKRLTEYQAALEKK